MIARRLARGSLFVVHPRVFAIGHVSALPLQDETAALLAVRDGAVLSHRTAAALWGLMGAGADVHVCVEGSPSARLSSVAVHRTDHLDAADRRIHKGLPVTSPARALLESAEQVPAHVLERAVSEAAVLGLLRPGELDDVLQRGRGRRGTVLLREVLLDASGEISDSEAEDRMDELIRTADLPRPVRQARPLGFRVDRLWPEARLIVEVDGFRFHSQRRAWERDRDRDARLVAAGYLVIRVSRRQIVREPIRVAALIAGALVRRQPVDRDLEHDR
jgi:very-short-patch-repair endonuclease